MTQVIEHFHFVRPLWLIAIVPFALLLWMYIRRSLYAGSWSKVCDDKLLPHILEAQEQNRAHRGTSLIGFLGMLAIIALAGPAWKELPQPVFRAQTALIIALDLSRSMDVADVKPSRLVRARHKIIDILNKRKEGQTALIVYALEPFVVTPLTQDNKTVANLVKDLETQLMPGQGSYPEKAITKSVELFKQTSVVNGQVLLITDGIESDGMEAAIQQLTDAGHWLSILGIGTSEGAPIARQGGGFLKDRSGAIVVSRLDEDILKEYALQGQGVYRHIAADDSDINSILRVVSGSRLNSEFVQQQSDEVKVKSDKWREEGPWILLILIPLVALVFRRGYLGVILLTVLLPIPQQSYAINWQSLWQSDDQRAAKALENNDPQKAANLFKNPQWKAAAQYRAKKYEDTLHSLEGINTPDALYNKGNTLAKLGRLQEAIASYNEALKLAPDLEDAKFNRDLLQNYLERQKQQQQDQKDPQQNGQQDNQQQDSQQQQSGQQGEQKDNQQQSSSQQNQQQNERQQNEQQKSQQQNNQDGQQQQSSSQQEEQQANEQEQSIDAQQQEKEKQAEEQLKQQLAQKQENKDQDNKGQENKDQENKEKQQQFMRKSEDHFSKENQQMHLTEQWLRRIPDDPGGLLRRKFRYQSQIDRGDANQETKPW